MAISSQGTTFTFPGFTAHYTSISVEEPQAEIFDMTSVQDTHTGRRRMVPTGDVTSPARIRVDYVRGQTTASPLALTGANGLNTGRTVTLTFSHPSATSASFTAKAVLESATSEIAVDQLIRGTLNFVVDSSI